MKRNESLIIKPSKRLIGIIIGVTTLLFIPLITMQFTNEVKWSLFDFLIAAILLFGSGLILEFILKKVQNTRYRIVGLITLFVVFFLIWAELAVGIFGTPFAGN